MMTCTKSLTAIKLPCPKCGEAEACISLSLFCLDDDDAQFTCTECEAEFGRNEITEFIRRWTKLLAWMDLAPDMDAE
jgi:hypothetical protein